MAEGYPILRMDTESVPVHIKKDNRFQP